MGSLSKAQGSTCVGLDNLEGLSIFNFGDPLRQTKGAKMSDQHKQSRFNRDSFIINSVFFLPAIYFGIALGNAHSDSEFTQGVAGIARIVTLVLVILYIRFTVRRLHDANRSGWFSFFLIPPFTLPLLIYLLVAAKGTPNKWGEPTKGLTMFGIRAKGWRIVGIIPIALFMIYLSVLFATFAFTGGAF